jgi:hydrogenase nickel incorporation protein HypA/HybF
LIFIFGMLVALRGYRVETGHAMHEITLCQRALELIEQQARQHGARRVTGVWLKIGAFSCVERSALAFCFELVCRDTLAEGCELNIEQQEAECWCHHCQRYVTLLSARVRRCPDCLSDTLRIAADDGLQIKRLEIE